MKASLILNLGHGIRKSKAKTWCVHDVNAKIFYHKSMEKKNQDHDKNTYPKLMLNRLKVMWDSIPIYIIKHITQINL
jgi:hypothetical protein